MTWPKVALSDILFRVNRAETPVPGKRYRQIGVRLWGEGAYEREPIDGAATQYQRLFQAKANDVIVNKIWARNGSVAVVPEHLDGCYGSNEFPMFALVREKLEPRWFHWMTKTKSFWTKCDEKSRGTSGQNRIRPERFLEIEILLPVLLEQRQIVTRIDDLDKKVAETKKLREQAKTLSRGLLSSAYTKIIQHVDYLPMSEVAPLKRRPVRVELSKEYLELGIRSFGKGTFHKPAVDGASLGTKRIFTIELGDLVFNNVFAWEGAVAVARPEDHGLVGSHRFITCVPKGGLAMSSFLCFHFLTDRGLEQLGEASPGGAGRNRTLGLEKLGKILVPVPLNGKLTWFDDILRKMNVLNDLWNEADAELGAFLPSVIANSFK